MKVKDTDNWENSKHHAETLVAKVNSAWGQLPLSLNAKLNQTVCIPTEFPVCYWTLYQPAYIIFCMIFTYYRS